MGGLSIWHLIFAGVIILLLFGGRGKISGIMGDTAKGIKAFREGLKGEEEAHEEEAPPQAAAEASAQDRRQVDGQDGVCDSREVEGLKPFFRRVSSAPETALSPRPCFPKGAFSNS